MSEPNDGEDDYIYRGEPSPQDGEPWDAQPPPPSSPPPITPAPNVPPPGFPPRAPPIGPPTSLGPEPAKKKRWPWILAVVLVFCALPLGGCVALIEFGVSEISERSEAVESTVDEFLAASNARQSDVVTGLADGSEPCSSASELLDATAGLDGSWDFSTSTSAFVERSGNYTLSSNVDPDSQVIDGRENESFAIAAAQIVAANGTREFQITLSKPASNWRICTIALR
jgi:hypothetical protein